MDSITFDTTNLSSPRLAIIGTPMPWAIQCKVLEDFPAQAPYLLRAGQTIVLIAVDAAQSLDDQPLLDDTTETERLILAEMKEWRGLVFDYHKCLTGIRKLSIDFPTMGLLAVAKELTAWLDDNRKQKGGLVRFRRFCDNAKKWGHHITQPEDDLSQDPLAWIHQQGPNQ